MKISDLTKIYLTPVAVRALLEEAEEISSLIKSLSFGNSCVFSKTEFDREYQVKYSTRGLYFPEKNIFSIEQIYGSFYWESPEIECSEEFLFEVLVLDAVKNMAELTIEQKNKAVMAPYINLWKVNMKSIVESA